MTTQHGSLWAVTSYFNPYGYDRRRINYSVFRRSLRVPLVTVELGFDRKFELRRQDAEIVIQVRDGDILWQKERLLNLAIAALPSSCDAVAWLDCDVVFRRPGWPAAVMMALQRAPLVQPYSRVFHLPHTSAGVGPHVFDAAPSRDGVVRRWLDGTVPALILSRLGLSFRLGYSHGHAWVARRGLLDRHGLYDAAILGGADKLIFAAAVQRQHNAARAYDLNAPQREHYFAWAGPFGRDIRGHIGFAAGDLLHLWHGDLHDRNYQHRHRALVDGRFDPYADISVGTDGAWRWNTDKPALQQEVADYFGARCEDGRSAYGAAV